VSDGGGTTRTGTATVLFTDLTGSTEARSRLGEETADELSRRHERLLATEISAHRGVVVKTLGDGVMATFGSAANAVAAAIAIQQTIADGNDDLPAPLLVRIGISAGDVAWRGNDCTGTPVIEAARLCNVAGPGEIVIADIVQAMARGRGGHNFVPLGALSLKGLSDPVPASRVRWAGDEGDASTSTTAATPVLASAPVKTTAPRGGGGDGGSSNRRPVLLAVGGAVILVLIAVGAVFALSGGDDGDGSDASPFCEIAAGAPSLGAEAPTEEERADALATLEELQAVAPNEEIEQDVVTIRDALQRTPGTLDTDGQAQLVASLVSLEEYLTENCPPE
jgi:class 3 adenylate cyclase